MDSPQPLLVLSTFPNPDVARQIGTLLVEKQLAACVNIIPTIESIYAWNNTIQSDNETLTLIKTTRIAYPHLESFLHSNHPYDTPEIIALEIPHGHENYLDWLHQSVPHPSPN
ncbi:MAG: divalent-cation tolerance protein CutA [Verrucomicrobiota bacterium]